jgi:hypothetical protein
MAAHSFSDMLQTLSNLLIIKHMQTFAKVAVELRGKKRPYFSKNPAELRKPQQLIGIFVETNLSANSIVAICRILLEKLGYDPNSLRLQFQ